MAKLSDIVGNAVRELNGKLKEIKDADEDDLAKVASAFDDIAERADQTATTLNQADSALSGSSKNGDDNKAEQTDEDEGEEQQQQPRKK